MKESKISQGNFFAPFKNILNKNKNPLHQGGENYSCFFKKISLPLKPLHFYVSPLFQKHLYSTATRTNK